MVSNGSMLTAALVAAAVAATLSQHLTLFPTMGAHPAAAEAVAMAV